MGKYNFVLKCRALKQNVFIAFVSLFSVLGSVNFLGEKWLPCLLQAAPSWENFLGQTFLEIKSGGIILASFLALMFSINI